MTKRGAKAIRKGARLDRAASEKDILLKIGADGWYDCLHRAATAQMKEEKDQAADAAAGSEKKGNKSNQGRDTGAEGRRLRCFCDASGAFMSSVGQDPPPCFKSVVGYYVSPIILMSRITLPQMGNGFSALGLMAQRRRNFRCHLVPPIVLSAYLAIYLTCLALHAAKR